MGDRAPPMSLNEMLQRAEARVPLAQNDDQDDDEELAPAEPGPSVPSWGASLLEDEDLDGLSAHFEAARAAAVENRRARLAAMFAQPPPAMPALAPPPSAGGWRKKRDRTTLPLPDGALSAPEPKRVHLSAAQQEALINQRIAEDAQRAVAAARATAAASADGAPGAGAGAGAAAAPSEAQIDGFTRKMISGIKCPACKGGKRDAKGKKCGQCRGMGGWSGCLRREDQIGRANRPFAHQLVGVQMVADTLESQAVVLLWDPGTGKSAAIPMIVSCQRLLLRNARVPKTILIVPKTTLDQWEDTLDDWLELRADAILVTNVGKKLTHASIARHSIVVTTPTTVYNAWKTCYEKVTQHRQVQTAQGPRWVSGYQRREGTPLHPLFGYSRRNPDGSHTEQPRAWDIGVIDEVHTLRNPDVDQTEAIATMMRLCNKRVGLTGTICYNHPRDMLGVCKALHVPGFMSKDKWMADKAGKQLRREAVEEFHTKHVHRVTSDEIDLPDVVHEAVNYEVALPEGAVDTFNAAVQSIRNLRMEIARDGVVDQQKVAKLMGMILNLQQYTISPMISENSADAFKGETGLELREEASNEPTGSFFALLDELKLMRSQGHEQLVVACNQVQMMHVVWLRKVAPELGELLVYDGSLSKTQRRAMKRRFLERKDSVLFLSIGAGGVGLNLVPGPEGLIFWGSSPYSPAECKQAWCRIRRAARDRVQCPNTGAVHVRHLVPYGSCMYSIRRMHADKRRLIEMCQENAWHDDDSGASGLWKRAGRIVDGCHVLEPDGNFKPMPEHAFNPVTKQPDPACGAFTVVPGVQTRGRAKPADLLVEEARLAAAKEAKAALAAPPPAPALPAPPAPPEPPASAFEL
jgi:hypothetical protein